MIRKKWLYLSIPLALILLISVYFGILIYKEKVAHRSILSDDWETAYSELEFLSKHHYSKHDRFRYTNILLNLYSANGQHSKALKFATASVNRDAGNFHANFHLGMYY